VVVVSGASTADHPDELDLLIDLHADTPRQGPGSDETTRRAIDLSGLRDVHNLRVADVGCGTGASTLVLARELDAHIVAVDVVGSFLERLDQAAARHGLSHRITTQATSMDMLAFDDASLDAIWSEGAIYNIGFEHGIATWRRFLRPGGVLAVSELTWFTHHRPAELTEHWTAEYPGVATASAKVAALEQHGYTPIGYFPLPEHCWLDSYYRPLRERFAAFLTRHDHSGAARRVVEAEQREIELYERFSAFFGYGFYVARRTAD
jgi:ubiquinone/menaquinone biosynthesis C-methylase UbiE